MFVHNIDPVLFSIGALQVRYYGLVYVLGFLLAYWFLVRSGWEKKKADDYVFYSMVGVVAGGRVGYFLFYSFTTFLTNPLEILMIWHGGMSFHGALIGIAIATLLFAKKHNHTFYEIADVLSLPAALALSLGRIANFINGEIPGTKSGVPWCVVFPGYDGCRHPVQLYLSLKNFAVAGILYFLDKKEREPGFVFWNFVLMYGLGRFAVDFLRADPVLFVFSMGQWLSLAMVLVSGCFLKGQVFNSSK